MRFANEGHVRNRSVVKEDIFDYLDCVRPIVTGVALYPCPDHGRVPTCNECVGKYSGLLEEEESCSRHGRSWPILTGSCIDCERDMQERDYEYQVQIGYPF
jgi:hypothetical protein